MNPLKRVVSLNGSWQLDGRGPDGESPINIPGTVPGMVHTDLLAAGKTDNMFIPN